MELTGAETQLLQEALLSAFPERSELRQFVSSKLDRELNEFAGSSKLGRTVFDLIVWAKANGKTEQLVRGARAEKPGNIKLREFEILYDQKHGIGAQPMRVSGEPIKILTPSLTVNPPTHTSKRVFIEAVEEIKQVSRELYDAIEAAPPKRGHGRGRGDEIAYGLMAKFAREFSDAADHLCQLNTNPNLNLQLSRRTTEASPEEKLVRWLISEYKMKGNPPINIYQKLNAALLAVGEERVKLGQRLAKLNSISGRLRSLCEQRRVFIVRIEMHGSAEATGRVDDDLLSQMFISCRVPIEQVMAKYDGRMSSSSTTATFYIIPAVDQDEAILLDVIGSALHLMLVSESVCKEQSELRELDVEVGLKVAIEVGAAPILQGEIEIEHVSQGRTTPMSMLQCIGAHQLCISSEVKTILGEKEPPRFSFERVEVDRSGARIEIYRVLPLEGAA